MASITVRELVEAYDALGELAQRKVKINPSFWLARQHKRLAGDYQAFIDKRTELIKQFGAEMPAGSGTFTVKPEHLAEFSAVLNELLKGSLEVGVEQRAVAFLAMEDIEPRLLGALHFLFSDEAPG